MFRILVLLGLLTLPSLTSHAQGVALSASEKPDTKAPGASREQRRTARKQWKADRKKKHARDKDLKNFQKHLQTKETRKRMKETKAKSERINGNKREFFLKRWFKRRLRTTKKSDR